MGHTRTIADLKKTNDEVNAYLDEIKAKLSASANLEIKDFLQGTKDFYSANNWDYAIIGSGDHRDFRQVEEFSLNLVADIVGSVAKGFFSAAPEGKIEGATDSTKLQQLPVAVLGLAGIQSLALNAALTLISDVLGMFSTQTSVTYNHSVQRVQLAPGLTLHMIIYTDTYDSKGLFVSKSIVEDAMDYQLIYSAAQAKTMGVKSIIDDDLALIEKANATLLIMNDTYDNMNVSPDATDEAIKNYQTRITNFEANRDNFITDINKQIAMLKAAA